MLITQCSQIPFFDSLYCNAEITFTQRTPDQSPTRSLEKSMSITNPETLKMAYERTLGQQLKILQSESFK